jgi:hypothetical protein
MKVGYSDDFTRDAWDRGEVGVWYGAWSARDLEDALAENSSDPSAYLKELPSQLALGWSSLDVGPAVRFRNITSNDWVVIFLRKDQEIGLAQVCSELNSLPDHPLNTNGEVFKYRKITNQKTFKLARLPDAYRLLPSQGLGNVYQFHNMQEQVKLLAESQTQEDVSQALRRKPFKQFMDFLGASAWESFCFAYLILEDEFVPTGLSIGGTLQTLDIVGRRKSDGARILAQCKKHPTREPIHPDFLSLSETLGPSDRAYYFAYGGCSGAVPANIRVVVREDILRWAESQNGALYRQLLLKD